MKTKLTLFVTVLAVALFGVGCASVKITEEQLQSGLVAHYLFNGNAKDASENALHGTLGGPLPTLDRAGIDGAALKFNGVSDFIVVPHSDVLNIGEGLTLSLWLRPDRWDRHLIIFGKGSSHGNNYDFTLEGEQRILGYAWMSGSQQAGVRLGSMMPVNRWFQIVVVHDSGKSLAMFVDGKKLNYTFWNKGYTVGLPRGLRGRPMWIGAGEVSGGQRGRYHYNGAMDDLRIYNRALSAEEVEAPTIWRNLKQNNYENQTHLICHCTDCCPVYGWVCFTTRNITPFD